MECNEETINIFLVSLDDLISKKDSDEALTKIFDGENEELIKAGSLDIVNLIGKKMDVSKNDIDEWTNLQSMLEYVVTISSPKEMLIGLLGLLETAESGDFFKLLVSLLRTVFLRLPSQRGDTLLCALSEIHDYIHRIPLPDYVSSLEGNEKALLENSPELARLDGCITATLNFCESLVQEAKECKLITSNERRQQLILAIVSFLMKLVEGPIPYFGDRFDCVDRLVRMLFDLKGNCLFATIRWYEKKQLSLMCRFLDDSKRDTADVHPVAIGALASLIYNYGICVDRMPKVYRYEYLFESTLPYVNALLKKGPSTPYIELGIDLLNVFSERISLESRSNRSVTMAWESDRLRNDPYKELFLNLINAMTYSGSERIRRLSWRLFTQFLGFFVPDGQMMVIRLVYHIFDQQEAVEPDNGKKSDWHFSSKGICGYLIDYYREQLNKELRSTAKGESSFASNLPRMIALFTRLKLREETDFLENFDQSMAVLNLVRYLCILRSTGKGSSLLPSRMITQLTRDFLEPMRKGLMLSRGHYELDLKKAKERPQCGHATSIPVNGAEPTDVEKISVLKSAINAFDLMMSLVARVTELLESCAKLE